MKDFLTLFKYEFKLQFSINKRKEKVDFVGGIVNFLITLVVIAVFIYLISTIAQNYVLVELNKIPDPIGRASELMNLCYLVIMVAMSLYGVEKMRKSLSEKKDKALFLRFPVHPQTIFLSKIAVLLLANYIMAFMLVIPVDIIFYIALKPNNIYWLQVLLTWIVFPITPFIISSLLVIPYIKIIDFLKERYLAIFILLSGILIGSFFLYSKVLEVVQRLLETGNIKFLFNEEFIKTLQSLLGFTYPANSLASITLGQAIPSSLLIILIITVLGTGIVYFITKGLFYVTLYKNEDRHTKCKVVDKYKVLSPTVSLMYKEFINVFREPKHMFSYFAISTAMPIMVYCCYTLFEALIMNTIGLRVDFALALFIILIFSVLTNTFCSTNISRDGVAFLKMKSLPVKPVTVLNAKVFFCLTVRSLAVIFSGIVLLIFTNLNILNGLVCILLGIVFSISQILLATKQDLNHAKLSLSGIEIEKESSKITAKVVFAGLLVALGVGVITLVLSILIASNSQSFNIGDAMIYLIPFILCLGYFGVSLFYYRFRIEKNYINFVA